MYCWPSSDITKPSFTTSRKSSNLLPNLKVDSFVKNFSVKTNDYMHIVYVSTLIRSVIYLHNLINNKKATKEIVVENSKKEEESRKKVEEALKKAEAKDDGDSKDFPQ